MRGTVSPLNRAGEGGGAGGGNPRFGSRGVSSPCIPCATMRNKGIVQNGGRARGITYHKHAMLCPHRTPCHAPRECHATYPSHAMPRGTLTHVRSRRFGQWSLVSTVPTGRRLARRCSGGWSACALPLGAMARCCAMCLHAADWVDGTLLLGSPALCCLARWYAAAWLGYKSVHGSRVVACPLCLCSAAWSACTLSLGATTGRHSGRLHADAWCACELLRNASTSRMRALKASVETGGARGVAIEAK